MMTLNEGGGVPGSNNNHSGAALLGIFRDIRHDPVLSAMDILHRLREIRFRRHFIGHLRLRPTQTALSRTLLSLQIAHQVPRRVRRPRRYLLGRRARAGRLLRHPSRCSVFRAEMEVAIADLIQHKIQSRNLVTLLMT